MSSGQFWAPVRTTIITCCIACRTNIPTRWPHDWSSRIAWHIASKPAADMFVMASRYEPCGLNQLYSLRYGTVPIVHHTGGLADTITDATPENLAAERPTGSPSPVYDAGNLEEALTRACHMYSHEPPAMEATGRDRHEPGLVVDTQRRAVPRSLRPHHRPKTRLTGGCCCRVASRNGQQGLEFARSPPRREPFLPPGDLLMLPQRGCTRLPKPGRPCTILWQRTSFVVDGHRAPLQLALSSPLGSPVHRARDPLPHADGWYQHHGWRSGVAAEPEFVGARYRRTAPGSP